HAQPAGEARAEVGEQALRIQRGVEDLGGGGLEHPLRRLEAILVPVERLELVQPVLGLEGVAAEAGVVANETAQRRPGERIPVDHAAANSRSAASSACTPRATASAPLHSSGALLTPPASLRTNSIALGTPASARMAASCPAPEGSSRGST